MKQFEKFSKICQAEYEQYAKATKNPMSYEQWLVSEAPDPKPETKSVPDDIHIFDWKKSEERDLEAERKNAVSEFENLRKEELRKEEEEAKAAEEILRSIRNFQKKYPDSDYEFRFSRSENFNDFLDWILSR